MACQYCTQKESIYEDDKVIAFLPDMPAAAGHIIIIPKIHAPIMEAISDELLAHMSIIANKISIAVFESIKSEGTNLIIQNGVAAGQEIPHFSINIITRRSGDGLSFEWPTKHLDEEEMATVELQLKEELSKPSEKPEEEKKEEKQDLPTEKKTEEEEKEESYLLRQLRRMP
jgi:histidine triad (HIT) family protein